MSVDMSLLSHLSITADCRRVIYELEAEREAADEQNFEQQKQLKNQLKLQYSQQVSSVTMGQFEADESITD